MSRCIVEPLNRCLAALSRRFASGSTVQRFNDLTVPLLAFCLCCLGINARAENAAGAFDAANKLYGQNKFTEAASAYEQLLQSNRVSAATYFNLGNAWFKSGQIGRAIAAYRHAEQLAPRDPDIRANLQFARNQIQGPTLQVSRWEHWLKFLTINEWTALAAVAFWLCLLLLVLIQFRPALKRALWNFVMLTGVATVVLLVCLGLVLHDQYSNPLAIVISPDAVVHNSPFDESPNSFTAHDGAEFGVLDKKNNWLQVSDRRGRIGWLRRDQVLEAGG
jgi:tetratricopeptide (TPR) repeat protein